MDFSLYIDAMETYMTFNEVALNFDMECNRTRRVFLAALRAMA